MRTHLYLTWFLKVTAAAWRISSGSVSRETSCGRAVLLVRVLCGGTHLEDGEAKVGLHAEVFYADLSLLAYTLRETVMHCTGRQ